MLQQSLFKRLFVLKVGLLCERVLVIGLDSASLPKSLPSKASVGDPLSRLGAGCSVCIFLVTALLWLFSNQTE